MDILKKESYNFEDLKEVVKILRSENGCPWDREQTHQSIRNNFIEEVYEAVEAIDENKPELLREELGDVLMQVVMHASISEDAGGFHIDDVCDEICKKLILRHPHVFGEIQEGTADTAEQVLTNWENIKIKEKGFADTGEYIKSTAKSLPALMRAEKIYKRAVKRELIGHINWNEKLSEDIENMKKLNANENDNAKIFETIGRILFNIAGLSSEFDINSEQALYDYTERFVKKMLIE